MMAKSRNNEVIGSSPNSYIFGDGNNLVILFEVNKGENAWTFKSPYITNINIEEQNMGWETIMEKPGEPWSIPPIQDIHFEIKGKCSKDNLKIETIETGKLNLDIDLLKRFKVSQLFVAINKKLKEREKQ